MSAARIAAGARVAPPRAPLRAILRTCGLLLAGLYLALVMSPLPAGSRRLVSADAQALVGHALLLAQGQVSGRDFGAAYGAVPQALARVGLALRAGGETSGAFPAIAFVLRAAAISALVAWATALPLPGGRRRAALVLLALAGGAAANFAMLRPAAALLVLGFVARALAPARTRPVAMAGAAGSALAVLALVSFDYFVFACGAAIGGGALLAIPGPWRERGEPGTRPRARLAGMVLGLGTALLALLVVARATAVDGAQGLLAPAARSLELAATYPLTFGLPWQGSFLSSSIQLTLALAVPAVALVAATRRTAPLRNHYLVLAPFALLAVKGALTRSDGGHVMLGLFPALLLAGVVALDPALGRNVRVASAMIALAALAVWPSAPALPTPSSVESWNPLAAARALRSRVAAPELLPGELLRAAATRRGPVYFFPLQIGFAGLTGRPLVAPVDQAYEAHTPAMQERVVAGLERAGDDLEVIYGVDGERTWPVDRVQSIARSPVLFDFLWSRFERDPAVLFDDGFLLLRRRAQARRVAWRPLRFEAHEVPGGVRVDLEPAVPCPLLRLGLELDYPAWRSLGWPAGLQARVWADGRVLIRSRLVPLDAQAPFRTYLSPLDGEAFARLFEDGLPEGAPILDRLDLVGENGGWFGVAPARIGVVSLECPG